MKADKNHPWLTKGLSQTHKGMARQGIVEYCATNIYEFEALKNDPNIMELVLPYMQEYSASWAKLDSKHLNTGYKAIKDYYQAIKNQL